MEQRKRQGLGAGLLGGVGLLVIALLASDPPSSQTAPLDLARRPAQGTPTRTATPCAVAVIDDALVLGDDIQDVHLDGSGVADTCAPRGGCSYVSGQVYYDQHAFSNTT